MAATLALALLTAACGAATTPGPATAARSSTTSAPATSAPGTSAPGTTAATGYLSGFGATQATWAAGHHPDPLGPAGNYWPRLSNAKDTYADVRFIGGRALSYVENLDPPETASQARSVVGDELPPDAHVVSDTRTAGGERLVEASPTLLAATGDDVAVEMSSPTSSYDPAQVTSLTYSAIPAASG